MVKRNTRTPIIDNARSTPAVQSQRFLEDAARLADPENAESRFREALEKVAKAKAAES